MDEEGLVQCVAEAPWWLDEPPPPELDVTTLIDVDDLVCDPLTVAETLLAVSFVGPGPDAQRLLSTLTGRDLSRDEALSVVQLWEAQEAWLVGRKHLALVAFAGPEPVSVNGFRDDEATVHELAPALRCTVEFAGGQITQARLLSGVLSATGDLLRAGLLSPYKAWLVCDRLGDLPVDLAREAEARALRSAVTDFPGSLSRKLRTAVLRADPARAAKAHREGRKDRDVQVETQERVPGLLALQALLPPGVAIAIDQRLDQKAAEWATVERAAVHHTTLDGDAVQPASGDGDDGDLPAGFSGVGPVDGVLRTKAQRRADALAWYILGPDPQDPVQPREPNVTVQVTVDLPTLLGLRNNPAHLDRFGPVPPEIARAWATDADWQLLIHEPVTGHLLNQGRRSYHPTRVLADHIAARDVTCRFPGCTRPAKDCDDDHTQPFNHDATNNPDSDTGGETSADNLAKLCRPGHRAKTFLNFTYRHLDRGVLEWTTPLGRTYRTYPHDYRGDDTDNGDGDPEPPRR